MDSDGSFVFYDVPAGVHMLHPFHMNLIYPEIRLEFNQRQVLTKAALSHNRQVALHSPLVLRPAGEAAYYEKRKPIDVWGFVKSPYGIMICFSLVAIFVFPRMKVDPEEFREMQATLRGAPAEAAASQGGGNRIRDR